ncbi:MAG: hypothetical protein A3J72_03375 [Nitrospirae bacterium RIFCSPHIGHO2_02_FULL_40_19]|nr:MAG: hypothetical protein A3J72_03375 [Nitrospirae bacterium RIFCSPHIGHO2_02_FULL_40_19]
MFLFVKVSCIIWASHYAYLTANAFFVIHHNDTILLILISCLNRTCPDTWGIIALVAQNRYEFPLLPYCVRDIPL